jgi:hypothetical protein
VPSDLELCLGEDEDDEMGEMQDKNSMDVNMLGGKPGLPF